MLALAGAVIVSVGLLVLATQVRSRSQAVADAGPPPAAVLTEVVELRVLETTVVVRGAVTPQATVPVSATAPPGSHPVVTAAPAEVGSEVAEGRAAMEVAGRPVLVLFGAVPAYRDLRPGDSGRDVAQLETALARLGYAPGRADGVFDAALSAAISATWRAAGYPPPVEAAPGDPTLAAAPTPPPRSHVFLPRREVAFVPALPVRVAKLDQVAEAGPTLTLAAGPLAVTADVDERDARAVPVGTAVKVLIDARQLDLDGRIIAVGAAVTNAETGVRRVPVTVETSAPLPGDSLGLDVRLTTTTARTAGEVLVVPVAALHATTDGGERVTVLDRDGSRRAVRVRAGLSSGGFVEIEPIDSGSLEAGDRVVVGR